MVPKLHTGNWLDVLVPVLAMLVMMLYVLMAMIRLAYFNVMEEKRQKEEGGKRKSYTGLPVTSAALIFPFVMLLQFMTPLDMTVVYYGVMLMVGYLFVSKIEVRKPGLKGVLILCGIGAVEFLIMAILRMMK